MYRRNICRYAHNFRTTTINWIILFCFCYCQNNVYKIRFKKSIHRYTYAKQKYGSTK